MKNVVSYEQFEAALNKMSEDEIHILENKVGIEWAIIEQKLEGKIITKMQYENLKFARLKADRIYRKYGLR
jgi:hypothetical protein